MREKYTPKTGAQGREPMPDALREFMAEIGRKTQIQALKEAGYRQKQIAEKLNLNVRYSAASLELSLGRHLRSLIRVLRFPSVCHETTLPLAQPCQSEKAS